MPASSNSGDPPDQHLFDESNRRPATQRQLSEFCKRKGLTERQTKWLTDFLDESGTMLAPLSGTRKRSRKTKTLDALPAPPAPAGRLPPPTTTAETQPPIEPVAPLPPTEPVTIPTRTSATSLRVNKDGIAYDAYKHETGHPTASHPWASVRGAVLFVAKPFISKYVVVTLGGVALGSHSLHEPVIPPPVGAGIETGGIPAETVVEMENSNITTERPKLRPRPVTPKPWYENIFK